MPISSFTKSDGLHFHIWWFIRIGSIICVSWPSALSRISDKRSRGIEGGNFHPVTGLEGAAVIRAQGDFMLIPDLIFAAYSSFVPWCSFFNLFP